MPSQSHHIMGESLLKALADKGHEVTMLSPFPSKNKPRNYNEILIPGVSKGKDEMLKAHIKVEQQDSFIKKATATSVRVSHTEEYDLAIAAYFGNDPVLAFAQRLAKHTIVFCTKGSHYDITKLTKVPAPSSYVPNLFPPLPDEMNLIQRIQNFLASVFYVAFTSVVLNHRQRSIIDRYLPNSPTIDQIHEHISLVLLNTHYSLETPRPYVPQMIQVAGLHLEDSAELTENLKTFMEEATEGAILFSLGSNVRSAELSEKTIQGIIKCFSKLPYKVLWKFDKYDNLNLPKNVIISKWLPQRDLLAHTNMKLFITHGGLLSLTEALYNSVPMIGIPLYGDQSINVAESVLKGYAVTLSFSDLSEEKLCSAITEVMTNTKYRKNMQIRSRIFRDQPVKPLQKAVFWVEYVLRHDGAHHLKTGALKLHWMQLYSVDTLSVLSYKPAVIFRRFCFCTGYVNKYFVPDGLMNYSDPSCECLDFYKTETDGSVLTIVTFVTESLVLIFIVITKNDCANILGIFLMPSKSHHILGETLLKALAMKGHNITMLSPFTVSNFSQNYNEILIPEVIKIRDEYMDKFLVSQQFDSLLTKTMLRLNFQTHLDHFFFNLPNIQALLNSEFQYDLAIAAWAGNDISIALAQRLAKHTVVFSTLGSNYHIKKLTKTPAEVSYVPHAVLPFADDMNFFERLQNFLTFAFFDIFDNVLIYQQRQTISKYIPNLPSVEQMYEKVSLVLLNTHYSLQSPRPTVPQIIQVGGLQLQEPKELTGNLKTIMHEASGGAILFSLGSNCFSKLPYTVLWKFEKSDLLNIPKNVIISDWFPQRDLLAHKNMKLFVTHGGLLSITEAIYNGVPIIGIPFYGDQSANVAESVIKGYGVCVPYLDLSERTLSSAIVEVMNNSKYQNNAQKISRIFKDQPTKPLDTAIFWVEYVLRHEGAHHLKNKRA
ncbi:hypothetical protein FQR65_LT17759 [Abscondita terminalis]|nr:hypothetical protein FQR65_LT17759 [Abscondita terminalis]